MNTKEKRFAEPTRFPTEVVVAMDGDKLTGMENVRGKLKAVSPEETQHAFIFAVARDIETKKDNQVLADWKAYLMMVPIRFIVKANEADRWKEAVNLRGKIGDEYVLVGRSTFQRIVQVMLFKSRHERDTDSKLSASKFSELFNKGISLADNSEEVTDGFVDQALTVYNRGLKFPSIMHVVRAMEDEYNKASPFNAMGVLHGAIQKGKNEAGVLWIVRGVSDLVKSKTLPLNAFNVRFFTGQGAGTKGLADLLHFKKEISLYYTRDHLDALDIRTDAKAVMRDLLSSFSVYRQKLSKYPDDTDPSNLGWMAGWTKPEKEALHFGEATDPWCHNVCKLIHVHSHTRWSYYVNPPMIIPTPDFHCIICCTACCPW